MPRFVELRKSCHLRLDVRTAPGDRLPRRDGARCIKLQAARSQYGIWERFVRSEPKYLRTLRSCARKSAGFRLSPSPHPGGPLIILLGGRSPDFRLAARCSLPTRDTFPLRSREQWSIAVFVPVTVAGAAPVSHRLPSPTNKRFRLSQKKISVSSKRSGRARYRSATTALKAISLDTIGSFIYVPSHSVKGKPVKIRRCPATVKGDEDPISHCESGKADPRMNPKPGDLPSGSKRFAFRGEGGSAFCARSRFEFRDLISH